jgi:hypothetical protein
MVAYFLADRFCHRTRVCMGRDRSAHHHDIAAGGDHLLGISKRNPPATATLPVIAARTCSFLKNRLFSFLLS